MTSRRVSVFNPVDVPHGLRCECANQMHFYFGPEVSSDCNICANSRRALIPFEEIL